MTILQDLFRHGHTHDEIDCRKTPTIPDLKVSIEARRSKAVVDAEAIKRRQDAQAALQARAAGQQPQEELQQASATIPAAVPESQAPVNAPRRALPRGSWGLPNVLARSSWATASRRRRSDQTTIASAVQSGPTVAFAGKTITQAHLTLLMELLRRCVEAGTNQIEVVPLQVLKAIGRDDASNSYQQFREWIKDMQHSSIQVEGVDAGESHTLIPKFSWRTPKGETLPRYRVTVASLLMDLMDSNEVTYINQEQRLQCGAGLAAWLHTFVSSHKRHGRGYCVETLTVAAGIGAARRCDDVKALRAAISVLIGIGALDSASCINPADGLVYLMRP